MVFLRSAALVAMSREPISQDAKRLVDKGPLRALYEVLPEGITTELATVEVIDVAIIVAYLKHPLNDPFLVAAGPDAIPAEIVDLMVIVALFDGLQRNSWSRSTGWWHQVRECVEFGSIGGRLSGLPVSVIESISLTARVPHYFVCKRAAWPIYGHCCPVFTDYCKNMEFCLVKSI
uniref:GST N-terminal domain-containing protein n=1 Tax=Panagrellus redivivus TaxID=6233 RepID=A0A7E4UPX6_PANRE